MTSTSAPFDLRLDGRRVLVTGAAGHLGAPISRGIAACGGTPVLAGRTEATLHALADEIRATGGQCQVLVLDVSDRDGTRAAIDHLLSDGSGLDGIVNAAYGGRAIPFTEAVDEDFEHAERLNVSGPFALIRQALPALAASRANGGASVVNLSSMYGHVSPDPSIYGDSGKNNPPFYGASKAALSQLTRYMAVHLAPQGVRVNSVSPGPFPPASIAQSNPAFHAALCAKAPLGRIGAAHELVGPVLFLLSASASYITGIDLPVDGGWRAW
ncbi:SDR family NAD(P)-dependent oxidoreductase [Ideonella margarita]|uniref:SDR family oxidoreductase n=1 Tax=Ideonella margarita TaxID=2984191 RepID=A0ABU9C3L2_9BURK